jgi:hypothetical protein
MANSPSLMTNHAVFEPALGSISLRDQSPTHTRFGRRLKMRMCKVL